MTATFGLETDIAAFTPEAAADFVNKLATVVFAIPEADITIVNITAASTVVIVDIFQRDGTDIAAALNNLNPAALSSLLGHTINSVDVDGEDVLTSTATSPASSPSSGLSPSSRLSSGNAAGGLTDVAPSGSSLNVVLLVSGASVGGGVGLLAVCLAYFVHRRRAARADRLTGVVEQALKASASFAFPLHLVTATNFLKMRELVICTLLFLKTRSSAAPAPACGECHPLPASAAAASRARFAYTQIWMSC